MFKKLAVYFRGLFCNKKGQGMVEYGLIIGLIAVVVVTALTVMGGQIKILFNSVVQALGGTPAP